MRRRARQFYVFRQSKASRSSPVQRPWAVSNDTLKLGILKSQEPGPGSGVHNYTTLVPYQRVKPELRTRTSLGRFLGCLVLASGTVQ